MMSILIMSAKLIILQERSKCLADYLPKKRGAQVFCYLHASLFICYLLCIFSLYAQFKPLPLSNASPQLFMADIQFATIHFTKFIIFVFIIVILSFFFVLILRAQLCVRFYLPISILLFTWIACATIAPTTNKIITVIIVFSFLFRRLPLSLGLTLSFKTILPFRVQR